MTTMYKYAIAGFAAALMLAGAAPVFAAVPAECVRAEDGTARTIDEWRACGNARLDKRITDLNAFMARIQAMMRLSSDTKLTLGNSITAQVAVMQGLKTQVAGAADVATLRPIVHSIGTDYRIYMLYKPQVAITANADKILTVTAILRDLDSKFKTHIDAAAAAGADVTALRANLTKLENNIASAESRAPQAVAKVKDLVPDKGDQTLMASNKQAISDARVLLDAALQDLGAARSNAGDIRAGLQAIKPVPTTITVTSPLEGAQWLAGQTYPIQWSVQGTALPQATVHLTGTPNGSSVDTLLGQTSDSQINYQVTVPAGVYSLMVCGTDCTGVHSTPVTVVISQ